MPSDPKIIAVRIAYFGRPHVLACDGRCDKAWGINTRPRRQVSDDIDDYVFWTDGELGTTPDDPGTYEGFQGKPDPEHKLLSKWCARECERSVMAEIRGGEMPAIRPPDLSVPHYNRGDGRNRYLESEDIEWLHPPDQVCLPSMPAHPMFTQSLPPDGQEEARRKGQGLMDHTDHQILRRIIGEVVPVEHDDDGMLSLRFQDGTRLSFLCGPTGRLNVVVVQHGPDTPEIRLPVTPGDCYVPVPTTIMRMLTLPEIERGWVDPGSGVGSPKGFTLLRRSGPDVRDGEIVRSPVAMVGWVEPEENGFVAVSTTGRRVFPSWDEAMAHVEAAQASKET